MDMPPKMSRAPPPPPPAANLFTYGDGSILKKMRMADLLKIEIWEGNRTLDKAHAQEICAQVQEQPQALDKNTYTIVKYKDQDTGVFIYRIIDGQHRVYAGHLLAQADVPLDFCVLVREITCGSEAALIEEFNRLNNTKAISYEVYDPKLAAQRIIAALETAYAGLAREKRTELFRHGERTVRPYMSVKKLYERLTAAQIKEDVDIYVKKVISYNEMALEELRKKKDLTKIELSAQRLEFALALDEKLGWTGMAL